jgi:HK97 family phage prohead protease
VREGKGATVADIKADIKPAGPGANRVAEPLVYRRWYALEDIRILRSGEGGDGRTVEAYAAVFDSPAQIADHEGEYVEQIDRTAFNRALSHARRGRDGWNVRVLYNHGYTVQGTPSERFSIPIGTPVDIRPEQRGLLTVTRYSETPLGDEILEAVRSGSVTSQSFSGRIVRSDPPLKPGQRYRPTNGRLPTVRRLELGLREYGPTPFPAYTDAEVLSVRMSAPLYGSDSADDAATRTADPGDTTGTGSDGPPAADDPPAVEGEHSPRYHQHALWRMELDRLCKEKGIPL